MIAGLRMMMMIQICRPIAQAIVQSSK